MENSDPKTVLVVDDEVHIVNVVSMKLRHAGYRVLTARDPLEALELARLEAPELIITDHHMPGGSGVDLCRQLHEDPRTSEIPIIFLTAYDFSIVKEEVNGFNVIEIMSKPFSPRELLVRAATIMESRIL